MKCALARTYARRFTQPLLIEKLVEFLLDRGEYAILNVIKCKNGSLALPQDTRRK